MVIFLKGILESLDQFIEEMANNINEKCFVIDVNELSKNWNEYDSLINENTIVITFNNIGLLLHDSITGKNVWEEKGVVFFNILVDHPFHYKKEIEKYSFNKLYYVCIDKGHVEYLRYMYPERAESFIFLPHGGTKVDAVDDNEKNIDIIYVGTCVEPIKIDEWKDDRNLEYILSFFEEYYRSNKNSESFFAVKSLLDNLSVPITNKSLLELEEIAIAYEQHETSVRRIKLINYLASLGFNITICGYGVWNDLVEENNYKNVNYIGYVSPNECVKLISKSKVIINDSPFFSYGAHERIFNGMINGAVVLTNESEYINERFQDGKNILLWDGQNTEEAAMKIASVLSDNEYRKYILNSAYSLTLNDTWEKRAMELIDLARKHV